jgi:hypothetical protein
MWGPKQVQLFAIDRQQFYDYMARIPSSVTGQALSR